jgi:predicted  nucleic acid-binding Zn-ribbon protein
MSEIWDLQSDVRALQSETQSLRTDLDHLLEETRQQRQELADLKRFFTALRNRLDAREMAVGA